MLPNMSPIINIAIVSLTRIDTSITAKSTSTLPKLEAMTSPHLEIKIPDNKALNSQLLCFEPEALNVDTGLPVLKKERLKQGVYY